MTEELWIKVYGDVQGVGFRWKAREMARSMNLTGYSKNLPDGTLEIIAQGDKKTLEKYLEWVEIGPSLARVDKIDSEFRTPQKKYADFKIEW